MIAIVAIGISIPGILYSKGNSLFGLLFFAGFILFFYSLLHPWQRVMYYAISIVIYILTLVILLNSDIDITKLEFVQNLPGRKAEDVAWAFGSIFVAGVIAGIIGIIRVRIFTYDD